ncbi:MAG: MarR family transcriptional regulator [Pseudomonadota bacterium]
MLCFSLYAASRAMTRVYQPLLEPLGLTYPQYVVLLALWAEDAQPVGQIGSRLGLESNTLTPLLKRMEAAGLIHRARNKDDERQVIISLSGKGRLLQSQTSHIDRCIIEASGLSLDQAIALTAEINALAARLMTPDTATDA